MQYVSSDDIREWLKEKEVYSTALGRVGKVLSVYDDGLVQVKTPNITGVTRFDVGDEVYADHQEEKIVILNLGDKLC